MRTSSAVLSFHGSRAHGAPRAGRRESRSDSVTLEVLRVDAAQEDDLAADLVLAARAA